MRQDLSHRQNRCTGNVCLAENSLQLLAGLIPEKGSYRRRKFLIVSATQLIAGKAGVFLQFRHTESPTKTVPSSVTGQAGGEIAVCATIDIIGDQGTSIVVAAALPFLSQKAFREDIGL